MKLLSIELNLFRQHRETVVEFTSGLTGVIGPNGSGKSTLMEAIVFALFGNKALRGSMDYVRTRGVPKAKRVKSKTDEARVVLAFEHDGVPYRVDRTLNDASLYIGGETEALSKGSREVSQRVATILGMSLDEFLATYFTEQKGLEFLSAKKGAAERERFLVKMMGYDKLEDVHELLRNDRKEKRSLVSGFEAGLGYREDIETRISTEEARLLKATEDLKKLDSELESNSRTNERLKVDFDRINQLKTKYEKFSLEIKQIDIRLDERSKRIKVLENELTQFKEAPTKNLNEIEAEIKTFQEKIISKENTWRNELSTAKGKEFALKSKENELQELKNKRAKLKEELPCPTCGQALGESFHHALDHIAKELEKITIEEKSLAKEIKTLSSEPTELLNLKEDLKKLEKSKIASRLFTEHTEFKSEIKKLVDQSEKLKSDLSKVNFEENTFLKCKGEYETASRLVEVTRLRRVTLSGDVTQIDSHLNRTREELMRYDTRVLEIAEKKSELLVYDNADAFLVDFRRYLNDGIRPRLAELASEYLAELTDGRYTMVDVSEDFSPSVVEDGETKSVISGGEEDVLNLCMRLALSHMLAERAGHDFSLLILDEVFGSLDEGRRANVLLLLEKLKVRFEQILLITHLEDVREGVENIIVVDYDEGEGAAKVITSKQIDRLSLAGNI